MVTPVGGRLVVDDAGEARTKSRVIGVGLAVEVRRHGGDNRAIVVCGYRDIPVVTSSTRDCDGRGAGSESEDSSRKAHDCDSLVGG